MGNVIGPALRKGPIPHARFADEQDFIVVPDRTSQEQRQIEQREESRRISRPMTVEARYLWAHVDDPELAQEQQSAMIAITIAHQVADQVSQKVIAHDVALMRASLEPLRVQLRTLRDAAEPILIRINQMLDLKRQAVNALNHAKLRASVALDSLPPATSYPTALEYQQYDEKVAATQVAVTNADLTVQGWNDEIPIVERERDTNLMQHKTVKAEFDRIEAAIVARGEEAGIFRVPEKKSLSGTQRNVTTGLQ